MTAGPEPYATRRELDQLRSDVIRLDEHGTRGVTVVQSQLTDVIRDVVELKAEINSRFSDHARQHERDEDQRLSGRRWALAFAVTVVTAIGGLYPLVINLHH
jgi:hypothetical protein